MIAKKPKIIVPEPKERVRLKKCWFCRSVIPEEQLKQYGHVMVCKYCRDAIYDIAVEVDHFETNVVTHKPRDYDKNREGGLI